MQYIPQSAILSKFLIMAVQNDLNYMANFKLIYSNLGYCYFRLNKFEQALEYHHKSTQLLAQIYPHKNEHLAFVYNHIGGSYHQLQQIDSALHYSNASIQIYETVLGKNNLALISPMRQKAKILKSTQRPRCCRKNIPSTFKNTTPSFYKQKS